MVKIPFSVFDYAVVSRESAVFIIGGICDADGPSYNYSNRIAKFTMNGPLGKWIQVGHLQRERSGGFRAIANGDRIYVVGGLDRRV